MTSTRSSNRSCAGCWTCCASASSSIAGRGDYLYHRRDGKDIEVLDLVGGYGSLLFGHHHPALVAEAQRLLLEGRPIHSQGSRHALAGLPGARTEPACRRRLPRRLHQFRRGSGRSGDEARDPRNRIADVHRARERLPRQDARRGAADRQPGLPRTLPDRWLDGAPRPDQRHPASRKDVRARRQPGGVHLRADSGRGRHPRADAGVPAAGGRALPGGRRAAHRRRDSDRDGTHRHLPRVRVPRRLSRLHPAVEGARRRTGESLGDDDPARAPHRQVRRAAHEHLRRGRLLVRRRPEDPRAPRRCGDRSMPAQGRPARRRAAAADGDLPGHRRRRPRTRVDGRDRVQAVSRRLQLPAAAAHEPGRPALRDRRLPLQRPRHPDRADAERPAVAAARTVAAHPGRRDRSVDCRARRRVREAAGARRRRPDPVLHRGTGPRRRRRDQGHVRHQVLRPRRAALLAARARIRRRSKWPGSFT